jgi:small-conductance mechanosensitive channel
MDFFDSIPAAWIAVATRVGATLLGALFVLFLSGRVQRVVTRRVDDVDARYRVRKLVGFAAWVIIALIIVGQFSSGVAGMAAGLGVAGAGVAFALQEVIASIAGWVAIMLGGFFRVGDRVQLGGIKGDVIDIGVIRTTLMETGQWVDGDLYNGRIVRIANSFVFKEPVFNYSGDFPFLWDEITIPVTYGGDAHLAKAILSEVAVAVTGEFAASAKVHWAKMVDTYRIEAAQVDPMVTLKLNDNWMEFTVRYPVAYSKRRSTKDLLYFGILDRFAASGGRVAFASATFHLVDAPTIKVSMVAAD